MGSFGLHGLPALIYIAAQSCVTTLRFSVNLNGELVGYFNSYQGLRQGDPLSPYLFTIVMEFLSMIFAKKTTDDPRFTFHWRCQPSRISQLCFADDLILFCGGSVQAATVLKEVLSIFTAHSGLLPNRSKSSVFVAGNNEVLHNAICDLFGFVKGALPVKYLGVLLYLPDSPLMTAKS